MMQRDDNDRQISVMHMDLDNKHDEQYLCYWRDPYDKNFFIHYIQPKKVFILWDRYIHMQTDSMLCELMAHQMEYPESFGLVLTFDRTYIFYLVISVDHDSESILIKDFINECYRQCVKCTICSMDVTYISCNICWKPYCSDECFESDRDQHIICYAESRRLSCRVCGKAGKYKCSACHKVRYCSVDCQRVDYSKHKVQCKKEITE